MKLLIIPFLFALCTCLHTVQGSQGFQGGPPGSKAAIVSTVYRVGPLLQSWVCYHQKIGFSKIYVFFDDPEDPDIPVIEAMRGVDVIIVNEELRKKQEAENILWPKFGGFYKQEVMARQNLNAETAARMAQADGIAWLLHIDSDEIFYLPPGLTLKDHFAELTKHNYNQAVYINYEAVPESSTSKNYFTESTLFKLNHMLFNNAQIGIKERWVKSGRETWHQGYSVGKAAGRVHPLLIPDEVTRYVMPKPRSETKIAFFDSPLILHYINGAFDHWRAKYQKIADEIRPRSFDPSVVPKAFRDKYQRYFPAATSALKFHLRCKELVMGQSESKARETYERISVLNDEREINRLLDAGMLEQITTVSKLIEDKCLPQGWAKTEGKKKKKKKKRGKGRKRAAVDDDDDDGPVAPWRRRPQRHKNKAVAPRDTCPNAPHFHCYSRKVSACQWTRQPGFNYSKIQIGYEKKDGLWQFVNKFKDTSKELPAPDRPLPPTVKKGKEDL